MSLFRDWEFLCYFVILVILMSSTLGNKRLQTNNHCNYTTECVEAMLCGFWGWQIFHKPC